MPDRSDLNPSTADFGPVAWAPASGLGYDECSLVSSQAGWRLEGALWRQIERERLTLRYRVLCDSRWATRAVHLEQEWLGQPFSLQLTSDNFQHWWMAGEVRSDLVGCYDVDIGLSPSTNVLPIRRLDLSLGEQRDIDVVWIHLPEREVARARQSYRRVALDLYEFRSHDSGWESIIQVRGDGMVIAYPGGWVPAPVGRGKETMAPPQP